MSVYVIFESRENAIQSTFSSKFLLNYGGALQDPREEAILKRLHDFNCEWPNRPNIAIPELAQTNRENIPLLKQYRETLLVSDFLSTNTWLNLNL